MIKNILYLSIFSTVVVVSWIAFSIYHNFTTSTIETDTSTVIVPITPSFDFATVQNLETRTKIPVDLSEQSPYLVPIVRSASPSAQLPIQEEESAVEQESEPGLEESQEIFEQSIEPENPPLDATSPAELTAPENL